MRSRIRKSSMVIAIVTIVAVLAMFTPASAAPGYIVSGPLGAGTGYLNRQAVLQKGSNLKFLNLDIVLHDVVMNHNSQIRSPLIGIGKQAFVVGANLLPKGIYAFHCSLHPQMKGKLRVI